MNIEELEPGGITRKQILETRILSPTLIAVLLSLVTLSQTALAIPSAIDGVVSFSGTATMDTTSFVTATKFTLFEGVTVGAESELGGDYLGTHGAAVTMTPFTWSPSTASTPINPLWSFVSEGITYSFDLSIMHMDYASETELLLSGFGTAHISGAGVTKLDTEGRWEFYAQAFEVSTFTFSSTTTFLPPGGERLPDGGATAWMLGASVCGLSFLNRKQKPSKGC